VRSGLTESGMAAGGRAAETGSSLVDMQLRKEKLADGSRYAGAEEK
jgi:hypothetical protein